ncbi:Os01g0834400, partial [Oryza sativa Japonica Group]
KTKALEGCWFRKGVNSWLWRLLHRCKLLHKWFNACFCLYIQSNFHILVVLQSFAFPYMYQVAQIYCKYPSIE